MSAAPRLFVAVVVLCGMAVLTYTVLHGSSQNPLKFLCYLVIALAASRPGVRQGGPDPELAAARAEIARLSDALKEMGVRLMLAEGKERWGEWPGPAPGRGGHQHELLSLIDRALAGGWVSPLRLRIS